MSEVLQQENKQILVKEYIKYKNKNHFRVLYE